MQHLLAQPDMQELIAAVPPIVRHLRPVCRMLGVRVPPGLFPPRRKSRRPPPPPKAEAPTPRKRQRGSCPRARRSSRSTSAGYRRTGATWSNRAETSQGTSASIWLWIRI
jgi:hypothetical protein